MTDVMPTDSFSAEFETKWYRLLAHPASRKIAFIVLAGILLIGLLKFSGIDFVILWFLSIIVVVISSVIILLIWYFGLHSMRSYVLIHDGFITFRRTRNGREVYKVPYCWATGVIVGNSPGNYDGGRFIPVYLMVGSEGPWYWKTEAPPSIKEHKEDLFIFYMQYDNKHIVAHINGQKFKFDRFKNSYVDVATKLTRGLCENVGITCGEARK